VQPKVVIKEENAPSVAVAKPKPKPKPVKKVKVDLHLVELPADGDESAPAPKPHRKTPTLDRDHIADDDAPDTSGLSKDQIAARLGKKLEAAGVSHADHTGPSGDPNGTSNPFADFYASINRQTMDKWQNPDAADQQAVNPVVEIHVEKDGRVPADRVYLKSGSGNQAIDESALNAARSLGYTLQPLPDGCPPDISITFELSH
jgi:outer membrane biosynthesis protein TonB